MEKDLSIPVHQVALHKIVKADSYKMALPELPNKTSFDVDLLVNVKGGFSIRPGHERIGTSKIPYKTVIALMLKKLDKNKREEVVNVILESMREAMENKEDAKDVLKEVCPELVNAERVLSESIISQIDKIVVSPAVTPFLTSEVVMSKIARHD